jgi:hypothetical protein
LMSAQPPLPLTPSGGVPCGDVAVLLQDDDGGRVFIRGELCFVWDAGTKPAAGSPRSSSCGSKPHR